MSKKKSNTTHYNCSGCYKMIAGLPVVSLCGKRKINHGELVTSIDKKTCVKCVGIAITQKRCKFCGATWQRLA